MATAEWLAKCHNHSEKLIGKCIWIAYDQIGVIVAIMSGNGLKVVLTSTSELKKEAVCQFFLEEGGIPENQLLCFNCDQFNLPPQPMECGMACASMRIMYVKFLTQYDLVKSLIVSIESDLTKIRDKYYDRANVRIELMGYNGCGFSDPIICPIDISLLESQDMIEYSNNTPGPAILKNIRGYKKTAGDFCKEKYGCDPKNWMLKMFQFDRTLQIKGALARALQNLRENITRCYKIKNAYKVYPNFPKEGVDFKYFYSLFHGNNMHELGNVLVDTYRCHSYDAILPLETRGLVLGSILADRLKTTMIPLQKPGKVPGQTISMMYDKEYGKDELLISLELFLAVVTGNNKSLRFLIVDDVIATGGSIRAVMDMLTKLADIHNFEFSADVLVLDEVPSLRTAAEEKIGKDYLVLFRHADAANAIMDSLKKKLIVPTY